MPRKESRLKKISKGKDFLLLLSVLGVVAVSGCVSGGLFGPSEQKVEAPSDVIAFSDSNIIPSPPILTGDTFTTSFIVKNLDEFEDAKNTKLQLYDWGVCEPFCKLDDKGVCLQDLGDVSPKDVRQIEYQFKAPSSERIGGMQAKCPIRYKLTYDFSGTTTTDLNVISSQKFQDMQRAGQTPFFTSTQTKSRGPIKVDFSFGVSQPVRTSTKDNTVKIPMYITIENKGTGKAIMGGAKADIKVSEKPYSLTLSESINLKNGYTLEFKEVNVQSEIAIFIETSPGGEKKSYNVQKGKEYILSEGSKLTLDELEVTYGGLIVRISSELGYSGSVLVMADKCKRIICDSFSSNPEKIDGKETGNCLLNLKLGNRIDFVKDKSQVFRCELTSPADAKDFEQKTYLIQSEVKYAYQIDNDFSVQIKPMTLG